MTDQQNKPIDDFSSILAAYFDKYKIAPNDIAVGVSGGPDSMALCFALSQYLAVEHPDVILHALTVDHGLRSGGADEALHVSKELKPLRNINHYILKWQHKDIPTSRIQEQARAARYDLMAGYMYKHSISHLFLGHHQGDQAETFLFRLSKGSGLDGLACMSPYQENERKIILCRPFLDKSKDEVLAFCEGEKISFISDPSNKNNDFARVRLRKSMDILYEEGLTNKRLWTMAKRFSRARDALDEMAKLHFKNSMVKKDTKLIVFNFNTLKSCPEEIVLRIIIMAMEELGPKGGGYGARMERVENLCVDLMHSKPFRKRTLGGIIFERNDNRSEGDAKQVVQIILSLEH